MALASVASNSSLPRVGLLARVRNRRGLIAAVEPFDTGTAGDGRLHAVRVEYTDHDGPGAETLIWEREPAARVVEPSRLPDIDCAQPMVPRDFDAIVRAARWQAMQSLLTPDGGSAAPRHAIAAPMFGAVQAEDFQLDPLLRALQMPRVSLLIADDVGLGKTIEAGLILTELLLRRRVRRVLILCPASLKWQWQQEMDDKFALQFDIVDGPETHALQRNLGLDANPWRTFERIIASYHYLRQPLVREQFEATCRTGDGQPQAAHLPWDLLIVDEAHNLMPSSFGRDSELTETLRAISPWFEHKLFLTATPHNGHTRCYTGLLELLDPVLFTQAPELTPAMRDRAHNVVIRRLKREINELDRRHGRPPRFAERKLEPVRVALAPPERALAAAFDQFRRAVKRLTLTQGRGEQLAGSFAVEVLNKRLLSCPATFADSWWRFQGALASQDDGPVTVADVRAAQRASEEDLDDDREREGRSRHAAVTVGAWLRPLADRVQPQIAAVSAALLALGLPAGDSRQPKVDSRFDALIALLDGKLRANRQWRADERLIVFTEYKTTLDYLDRRLRAQFGDGPWLATLYGGVDPGQRRDIKDAFNDPAAPVRVLLATDTASEGLNLQETARHLLHYDIPWNPSRLEQRNGRLDRHGQARDVTVFHFASDQDADLQFLAYVVHKVQEIREDLGAVGEVFDAAFERRFLQQDDADAVRRETDAEIARRQKTLELPGADEKGFESGSAAASAARREADLQPIAMAATLDTALRQRGGSEVLNGPDACGFYGLAAVPPGWAPVVDESLRLYDGHHAGALPRLAFDPEACVESVNGRRVFRPRKDVRLLHLGHPVMHQAVLQLCRARFRAGDDVARWTRWTVRVGGVPEGASALVLLTLEELAVNELREPMHHWVRTLRLPVKSARAGAPLPHRPPGEDLHDLGAPTEADIERARDVWLEVELQVKDALDRHKVSLDGTVRGALKARGKEAEQAEAATFKSRIQEVDRALQENQLDRLKREIQAVIDQQVRLRPQQELFQEDESGRQVKLAELGNRQQLLEEELARRTRRYGELRLLLLREQTRVLELVVPKRHRLAGDVQVYPVAVEVRVPAEAQP